MDQDQDKIVLKAGHQSEESPDQFILSSETVDRMGDIIRMGGIDLNHFKSNPIALLNHDHDSIIGVWENVRVEGKKLMGTLKLAKEGTSELVDTVRSLVEQRILRATSVGFQPIEAKPRKSGGGYEFTKTALHEVSLVAVPANPEAIGIKAFKALHPEIADKLFVQSDYRPAGEDRTGQVTIEKTPNLDKARERVKSLGID